MNFLEYMILKGRYSPAAALAEARVVGYTTTICVTTLYSYISKRRFPKLRDMDLPEKVRRRQRKKREEPRIAHKDYPSIEARPVHIGQRSERGHWEMDLVVGCRGSKAVLLTLTERRSREEIIMKLPDRRAETIRKAIDRLERRTPQFRQKFRSITTDNGSEFLQYEQLIRSIRGGTRFQVYYCHSYAAWEKGSNENHNRMIRRFFPKGTNFDKVKHSEVKAVQDWMNNYPRKILGWKRPSEIA